MEEANYNNRFKEYDDLLAGLSSDEENKTKSQKKSNLQSESPKKDSKYKPEKPDFIQKHNEPHYNGEKNILMDSPQRPMENFNFTKPVARIGDDYDDLIEQMEDEEFKGETERIPPKNIPRKPVEKNFDVQSTHKTDPILKMIESQRKFSNPSIIQSFLIINSELDYINEGLKRKDLDQRLLTVLKEAKDQICNNKKNLENSYQCGKLNGKSYLGLLEKCFNEHQTLFKEAKFLNDKQILSRLAKRLDLITKEKNKIKQDPINEFVKFMKFINPSLQVDPNKKFISEIPKKNNAPIRIPKLTSDYKGRANDFLEEEQVDSLPQTKKVLFFKKRHKQYHNLAMYFSKNVDYII